MQYNNFEGKSKRGSLHIRIRMIKLISVIFVEGHLVTITTILFSTGPILYSLSDLLIIEAGLIPLNQQNTKNLHKHFSHFSTKPYLVGSRRHIKWASTQLEMSSGNCKQQRHRPACASAQSDQCLYYALI